MKKSTIKSPAFPAAINYQWVIFAILSTTHMMMAMFFYSWGPLAPIIKEKTLINNSEFGLIVSTMYFVMVIISIPSGFLTDKYGAKWMLLLSGSLMGAAFFLMPLFPFYGFLFVVAALAGAGYGMINQITAKGLMYWFEPDKRATVMGIKQTGVTIGGGVIGIYIPFFGMIMGWQKAIMLLVFVIFGILLFSYFFYKEKPTSLETPSPSPGTAPNTKKVSVRSVLLKPALIFLTAILTLFAICQACLTAFLVIYVHEVFHLSIAIAGSLFTVAMVGGTISRILFGLISDRLFRRDRIAPLALLALIGVLSTLSVVFLNDTSPLWLLFIISAFLGVALMGWNSLAIVLVAELAGNELVGSVMGVLFAIAWGGMVIGPPIFGAIIDLNGYNSGWLMLSILLGISCFGLAIIRKIQKKESMPGNSAHHTQT
jgi:MFS family permease